MELIIGNKNYSSWSMRPWLALKHGGIPFDERMIHLYEEDTAAKILTYNEAGQVPVLRDGDLTIWESLAICEYAAEKAPQLWPQDPTQRAWARSISSEMHAGFPGIRNHMPVNLRKVNHRLDLSEAVQKEIERVCGIWNKARAAHQDEGPWLFGSFTVADAMYAPVATRFHSYGIELDEVSAAYVQTVLNDSHMKAWYAAAAEEPQIIQASEV